jgi:hypothetical protein
VFVVFTSEQTYLSKPGLRWRQLNSLNYFTTPFVNCRKILSTHEDNTFSVPTGRNVSVPVTAVKHQLEGTAVNRHTVMHCANTAVHSGSRHTSTDTVFWPSHFFDVRRRWLRDGYRHFGTVYRSHLHWSTTHRRRVPSLKTEGLKYIAAYAWNLPYCLDI